MASSSASVNSSYILLFLQSHEYRCGLQWLAVAEAAGVFFASFQIFSLVCLIFFSFLTRGEL